MRLGVGNKDGSGGFATGQAARTVGRVALWAAVAVLLVRGGSGLLGGSIAPQAVALQEAAGSDDAVDATAVRFARAYLAEPSPQALQPFLAAGAWIGAGRPPSAGGAEVAQAEVVHSGEVGDGQVIVTVACELRDSRTLYLAVPIARFGAGEVAVLGAPSIVAVPAVARADPERPQPIAGSDGPAIEALVAKFLPAYLASAEESDLSYYLASGASVIPLGGAFELVGVSGVTQLGSEEGDRRTVIAAATVRDPGGGGSYPLAYRLELVKIGRWYVQGVEGAPA